MTEKIVLVKDAVITVNGRSFKIIKTISDTLTGIIYSAKECDTESKVLIKEIYPSDPLLKISRRKDNSIRIENEYSTTEMLKTISRTKQAYACLDCIHGAFGDSWYFVFPAPTMGGDAITLSQWMYENRGNRGYVKNLLKILLNIAEYVRKCSPRILLSSKPKNTIVLSEDLNVFLLNFDCQYTIEEIQKTEFMNISAYTAPEIRSEFNAAPDPERTSVFPIGAMLHEGLSGEPLTRPKPRYLRKLILFGSKSDFDKCYKMPMDDIIITEELKSVLTDILKSTLSSVVSYRFNYYELYIALNKAIKLAE